jgi:hypothetical protein
VESKVAAENVDGKQNPVTQPLNAVRRVMSFWPRPVSLITGRPNLPRTTPLLA